MSKAASPPHQSEEGGSMTMQNQWKSGAGFLALVGLLALAACGGGGGASVSAPSSAPAVTVAYQTKQIALTWNAVSDATYYRVLKNPDGVSGYSVVNANVTGTSYADTVAVHRADWVNQTYQVEACNSGGCTKSTAVAATDSLSAIGYVKAFNTDANDAFGATVAISGDGNTLAVAAQVESSNAATINGDMTNNSANASGAVYIYVRETATGLWQQQAYLKASNAEAMDFFGTGALSISTDGNTVAVGAFREQSSATGIDGNAGDNSAFAAGAVYVFVRTGTTWNQQAYVKASNTQLGDAFGSSVALAGDGNTLAVGAIYEDGNGVGVAAQSDNSVYGSGAVYIFMRSSGTWSQQAYLKASNPGVNDNFGNKLSLSSDGNTLAVGAYLEDSNATGVNSAGQADDSAVDSGAVYVFTRSNNSWSQQAYLKASNTEAGDWFGCAVSLSGDGNTLAVGAYVEGSNATGMNGNGTNNSALGSGAVYLFNFTGGAWGQQAYLKASNTGTGDNFGFSVGLSFNGNTLAVGAPGELSNASGVNGNQADNSLSANGGAVYVFDRSGITWSQKSYVKATNPDAMDYFGIALGLSSDGNTLAVGAYGEGSAATGIGGNQSDNSAAYSGAVYLY